MDTSPYQRLELFWQSKGLKNAAAFAETVEGLNSAALSAMKQRRSMPSAPVMRYIQLAYPDINTDYILWGTGPMLKDGRALTSAAPPETVEKPEPPTTPTGGASALPPPRPNDTVAQAENVLLKEQVFDLKEDKSRLVEENQELRAEVRRLLEKFSPSLDAAELPVLPRTEIRKWPTACQPSAAALTTLVVSHSNPFAHQAQPLAILHREPCCVRLAA